MVLDEIEKPGYLGSNSVLLLPEQNSIQSKMRDRDCWRLPKNLALLLVEELPRLDLTILL